MPDEIDFAQQGSWRAPGAGAKVARYEASTSRIIREAFNHDIVRKNTFLKKCSAEFVDQVVAELQVALFTEGADIVKEGDAADVAYFLNVGKVEVLVGPTSHQVAQLSAGSFFGEMALFQKSHKRTATIRALEFCDCRVINHSVFQKILFQHPADQVRLQSWSCVRQQELNKIKEADHAGVRRNSLWKTVIKSARNIIDRRSSWPISPKFSSEDSKEEAEEEKHSTPKEAEQVSKEHRATERDGKEGISSMESGGPDAQAAQVLEAQVPTSEAKTKSERLREALGHGPSADEQKKVREAEGSITTISTGLLADSRSDGSLSSDEAETPSNCLQASPLGKRTQELPLLEHAPLPRDKEAVPQRSSKPVVTMPPSLSIPAGYESCRSADRCMSSGSNCSSILSGWRRSNRSGTGSSTGRPQLPPPIRRRMSGSTDAESQADMPVASTASRRPVRRRSCLAAIVPQSAEGTSPRKPRRHSTDAEMLKMIRAVDDAREAVLPSLRERGIAVRSHRSRERTWTARSSSRDTSRTSTLEHLSLGAQVITHAIET